MKAPTLLGISAFYHDAAAALIRDGRVVAAAQEERFTRKKHTAEFPLNAIRYCLQEARLPLSALDAVVFYDKPLLKFERLLETYYAFAPRGLVSFLASMPVWVREKMFLKKIIRDELKKIEKHKCLLLFPEHHLSHAASAFFASPFEESAVLTVDGVGEWATASLCHGKQNRITLLKELRFPHSPGLLYSAFTYYAGFTVNSGEYKLMGLAPYGNPRSKAVEESMKKILDNLAQIKEDGSLWLNQDYFDYATGLKMVREKKWERLFGFPRRAPESELTQEHCDLALAVQKVTEEILLKMAAEARRLTGSKLLCMAGGVALNCVANSRLLKTGLFDDIYVQPAAGDAGGALGAALAAHCIYFNADRPPVNGADAMQGAYLGPAYANPEAEALAGRYGARFTAFGSFDVLADKTASLLNQGNVVGFFQGRMEFGPRALGNRSILADARDPEMQKRLNLKIKYREGFRPFAPAVLYEDSAEYFEWDRPSPYMLFTADVREKIRKPLPGNYHELPLRERLYHPRSAIPAVTHLDFSARLQTVHKETNERFWKVLAAFKKQTGCPVLVNTSFNVRGEPIVMSPDHAFRCFMRTEMDYLVINDYLFDKKEQPDWRNREKWAEAFGPD